MPIYFESFLHSLVKYKPKQHGSFLDLLIDFKVMAL